MAPSDDTEKPQHRCTTTVHPPYNSSKKIFENLLPVGLLVRTNLFIPSRFWTTYTKFDTCCQRYIATCGKIFLYRCTSTVSVLICCSRFFSNPSAIYIRSGAHNLFLRFFDLSQFFSAISLKLWRHLGTNMRTK